MERNDNYLTAPHGTGSDKGMQSPPIKNYCLLQSTTGGMLTTAVSSKTRTKKDMDMGERFLFDGFRKTMVQTQKASNSDPVPMELPSFGEKENIKDEENRLKVVTLPDHLILDHILPRLPIKPLLRFKSVCKDWRFTISTPEFEKSRLVVSGSHHQFVLLKDDGWFSPSIINNPNYLIIWESYKYNDKDYLSRIIGCCKGLVGLSSNISHGVGKFFVLNPATGQRVEILAPDDGTAFNSQLCWFGYVSSVDDYYIVAFYTSGEVFWTFSWKAGIWKRNLCTLNWHARRKELIRVGKPALINDSLYWPIDFYDPFLGVSTEIVEINLVTEEYEIKPRMNFAQGANPRLNALVNLEGCLALHTTSKGGCLDVWMLRQASYWNSWENIYSQLLRHCRLIYYSTTGKLLVGHSKQIKFVDDLSQLQPEEQESDDRREIWRNCLTFEYDGIGDYVESMNWPF